MIKLNWILDWKAYAVRVDGHLLGLVRCQIPFPFRGVVEIA